MYSSTTAEDDQHDQHDQQPSPKRARSSPVHEMQDKKEKKQANIQRLLLAQNAQLSIVQMAGHIIESEHRHLSKTRSLLQCASDSDEDGIGEGVVYRSLGAKTKAVTHSTMMTHSTVSIEDLPEAVQQEHETTEKRVGIALELLMEVPPNDEEAEKRFEAVTKQIDTVDALLKALPSDSTFKFDDMADNTIVEEPDVWVGHGMVVQAMKNVGTLNKHIEDSMPTSYDCAICFEDGLELPKDQVATLPCTHKFCKDCFCDWANSCRESRPWMQSGCVTCPLCRATVPDANASNALDEDEDEDDVGPEIYRSLQARLAYEDSEDES